MCNPLNAYQEAVKNLINIDPGDAPAKSGCIYDRQKDRFEITYFGRKYLVERDGRVIKADSWGEDPSFTDKTLMVQYLCKASGLPPGGKWLSFQDLPQGTHHYPLFKTSATAPLAAAFGSRPDKLALAAASLGGNAVTMGDHSFYIPALPKIPLAVVLWEADEEFPAKSNILFDSAAQTHLTTPALWVLGVELARKMIGSLNKKSGMENKLHGWKE